MDPYFFNRDISWLSFNERLLMEAATESVPLMERVKFLSIFSSNLDEFYRVRIPALTAFQKIKRKKNASPHIVKEAFRLIHEQQETFGRILNQQIIPQLKSKGISLVYNEPIPEHVKPVAINYFFYRIAAFLKIVYLNNPGSFFPVNNQLYLAVTLNNRKEDNIAMLNIPSDNTGRFLVIPATGIHHVIFIDDIIRLCLPSLFPDSMITGSYAVKITRDAELDLQDEYDVDIAEKLEQQIQQRDFGLATRFLYQPGTPETVISSLISTFNLDHANIMQGGNYHNLKDMASIPVHSSTLLYPTRPPMDPLTKNVSSLFTEILDQDILIHPPYQSYHTVLRFFNEAAFDRDVEEIYTTLYRVASESQIVHALISAAMNGKKVTVFVELKARFDEANNIRWGKRMKSAGVKVIYSIPGLKVHAKVALLKMKKNVARPFLGLLATGNLNEITARFYTDHILLTSDKEILGELEKLFLFLGERKKPDKPEAIPFKHLLVAQFNLQRKFLELIDREIYHAKKGLPAAITIKLNNLEEQTLITKLYEAGNAGVKIQLLVRSVCCLVPGIPGMSENIVVKRIVDRYLEHGRIFIFHNNNNEQIFLGSSDWMNRNIYYRVEVCFPLYTESHRKEIKNIISLQLNDNVSAVFINENLKNCRPENDEPAIRSQEEIYEYLRQNRESSIVNRE